MVAVQTQFYADVKAQADAQAQAYGSAGAQWLNDNTGVDVNNQTTAQGASAAVTLFKNGYDPTNQADNDALVFAIAAGLNAIQTPPGIGTILSGALITLYEIAKPIACPVAAFFHTIGISQSDCNSPPCVTNGPAPTPASVMQASQLPSSAFQAGTFANFVCAALAQNAASIANCKSGIPAEAIVDACVNIWNKLHAGPAVDLYVPPLVPVVPLIPVWTNVNNNVTGSVDPNVFYAFAPLSSTYFGSLASAPAPPPSFNGQWLSSQFATGNNWNYPVPSAARTISVNSGALLSAGSDTSSVGKKVAVVATGGVAGALIYAYVAGKSLDVVFGGISSKLAEWARGAVSAVDGGLSIREVRVRSRGSRKGRKR